MSTFEQTIQGQVGKAVYVIISGTPVEVTIVSVNDDLVVLQPSDPHMQYKIAVHINNIMLAFT